MNVPASSTARDAAIARAQVWMPTDIATKDLKTGPTGPGAFPFEATIECEYRDEVMGGASPKFTCVIPPGDKLKVKYGRNNAEVYGEVAASRLLWALGFGADRMYAVRVVCRGCPRELGGAARGDGAYIFDPAAVERKAAGVAFRDEKGWAWPELDKVDERAGGAPRAHVDALTLLAVFIQHTDAKAENQRLVCLGPHAANGPACGRPFMLMHDVGLTFGKANPKNVNERGMNLHDWARTPVWKSGTGCVGNLPRSFKGTLDYPVIGEAGRAFLAGLLMQLSEAQIRDLFAGARVHLRLRDPANPRSGLATVDEWVSVFRQKRQTIVNRRCPPMKS